MKYSIWAKASVIMMKYAPRVRSDTAPISRAASALTSTAAGQPIQADATP